ncbi:response regulator, partial [Microbacterium sp.]|uniref:response regulator n=1 Tax=Microbacterium sp. TaxID=51671 RepID=UPI003C78D70F
MIRVLVADDHPIVRSGIAALIRSAADLELVGEAADGVEAVQLTAAQHPDVVLMDLRMPGLAGDEATARILSDQPQVRVVVLTTYESDDSILAAIEAGAHGYLLKAAPEEEILAGVRSVAAGGMALAPSIAAQLVRAAAAPPTPTLSPRELEVLTAVAAGRSNREIAATLYIGEETVKTHLQKAFTKLGVDGRTRAVTRAMELGLLPA